MEYKVLRVVTSVDGANELKLDGLIALQIISLVDIPGDLSNFLSIVAKRELDRSARVSQGIVDLKPSNTVVPDSLGGNDASLVSHTAEDGTVDDGTPSVVGLDDLDPLRFIHLLQSITEVTARSKTANQEDALEPVPAVLL